MSGVRLRSTARPHGPGDPGLLGRCRVAFAALNVVNALAVMVAVLAGGQPAGVVTISVAGAAALIAGHAATLRRRDAGVADELAVAAGMLAASLAVPDVTMTVSLVFSAVMYRCMYGGVVLAAARAAVYVGVYAAALHLGASSGRLDTTVQAALLLPLPALVMSTVTMRVLHAAVRGRDAAIQRQSVLAGAAAALLGAADRDAATGLVWGAQRELLAGHSGTVVLLEHDGDGRYAVARAAGEPAHGPVIQPGALPPAYRSAEPIGAAQVDRGLAELAPGARWWHVMTSDDDRWPAQALIVAGDQRLHPDVSISSQALMRQAALGFAALEHRIDLHRQAAHDGLTGLPNRREFMHRLAGHSRSAAEVTVLFIDLDGFKPVNDAYGHAAGDEMLVELGRRLSAAVPETASVARLGGDEFAVLLPGAEGSPVLAARIEAVLSDPVVLTSGDVVTVGASVGVRTELPPYDPEQLLRAADEQMYAVKAERREHRRVGA